MARNFKKTKIRGKIGNPLRPTGTRILKSGPSDKQSNTVKTNVKTLHQKFSQEQYCTKTNTSEPVDLAAGVLSAIGCSILDLPIEYSLMEVQTDQEVLLNVNITNLRIADLKPIAISALNNMGSNDNDPFWNLDPGISIASKNLNTQPTPQLKQLDATQITAELINYNMSNNTSTLKEFK
jgi:hypothetical protein